MAESLRARQKELTRDAILEALAARLAEIGSFEFSVAEIAERAGVSHRTVYNYFGDRSGLIDAFSEWVDRTVHDDGGVIVPEDLEDLPDAVATNFEIFEEQADIAEGLARMDTPGRPPSARARRTEAFLAAVASAYPEMEPRHRRTIAALLRQIVSVRSWYSMTREHGLSTEEAASVTAWALRELKASLDRGSRP